MLLSIVEQVKLILILGSVPNLEYKILSRVFQSNGIVAHSFVDTPFHLL